MTPVLVIFKLVLKNERLDDPYKICSWSVFKHK